MVWNTTMLFFQILLLGGYLYAHVISKISVTNAIALHTLALLAAGLVTLPMPTITPPDDIGNPLWWQITMMMGAIGLPFLFLSATAPLLQKWFSQTSNPTRPIPISYASSNASLIGSGPRCSIRWSSNNYSPLPINRAYGLSAFIFFWP